MTSRTKIDWCDFRKGDSRTKSGRYILVYCPEHPRAKGTGHIFEHRCVMEKHLGRFLSTKEHVHHIDGDGANNTISNLQVIDARKHAQKHYRSNPELQEKAVRALKSYAASIRLPRETILCACGCGKTLIDRDSKARLRRFIHGHNQVGKHWKWERNSE